MEVSPRGSPVSFQDTSASSTPIRHPRALKWEERVAPTSPAGSEPLQAKIDEVQKRVLPPPLPPLAKPKSYL